MRPAADIQALVVLPAEAVELPVVQALAHAIWPVSYQDVLLPEQIENMLERIYSLENLRTEMASGHRFFIAWEGAEPIGYASAFTQDATIWIKKLYVLPQRQGHGIGTRLMRTAVSALLPAERISLLVNNNNTPAMAYYERIGMKRTGETPVKMGDYHFTDIIYSCPVIDMLDS